MRDPTNLPPEAFEQMYGELGLLPAAHQTVPENTGRCCASGVYFQYTGAYDPSWPIAFAIGFDLGFMGRAATLGVLDDALKFVAKKQAVFERGHAVGAYLRSRFL